MIAPFPFASLPRWTRADATRMRSIVRRLAPPVAMRVAWPEHDVLPAAWSRLMGGALRVAAGVPGLVSSRALRDAMPEPRPVAAVFDHTMLGPLAVLIDRPLAHALAARALGAPDDEVFLRFASPPATLSPAAEGALAMLCAQGAAYRAPVATPVIRGVTDAVDDAIAAVATDAVCVALPFALRGPRERGTITVVFDAGVLERTPWIDHAPDAAVTWLADARVAMDVVLARSTLSVDVLRELTVGDVLALDETRATGEGQLEATVHLRAGEVDVVLAQRAGTNTVVRAAARSRSMEHGEGVMDAAQMAQLPIEVEVVLARATFTVAEIGAWRVGEVVTWNTPLGELVLVRAGGRGVARGELCEVDGCVGVRITERIG